jgi:hypothetical protein
MAAIVLYISVENETARLILKRAVCPDVVVDNQISLHPCVFFFSFLT